MICQGTRGFSVEVQRPNSVVLLVAHHPSTHPSSRFSVVTLVYFWWSVLGTFRGISCFLQSRHDAGVRRAGHPLMRVTGSLSGRTLIGHHHSEIQ